MDEDSNSMEKAPSSKNKEGNLNDASLMENNVWGTNPHVMATDNEKMEIDKIYWKGGVYEHVRGMVFDPDEKRYYHSVSSEPGDLRCLYYLPNKGEFMLAVREVGANNRGFGGARLGQECYLYRAMKRVPT